MTTMEDNDTRLHNVELNLAAVNAVLPALATKADLEPLRTDIAVIKATFPTLATKADMATEFSRVREEMSKLRVEVADKIEAQTWKMFGAFATVMTLFFAAQKLWPN